MTATKQVVLITGATGYVGGALSAALVERGHEVHALIRPGTAGRVARGARVQELDLFAEAELARAMREDATVVHLIGTAHPNPRKAAEFRRVDLASVRACAAAAARANVPHFVYVSVAQPAPVMHAYVQARAAGERAIAEAGLTATILRPWYVLGPGRRWPLLLVPLYACARLIPSTRETALRLGLVTLAEMVRALVRTIEAPPRPGTTRVIEVPQIAAPRD